MSTLPNPFLNSVDGSPPSPTASTADSECRLQNVARPDATAERDPHPNSVSPSPDLISEHAKSAVASSDLQPRATAEPFSVSDGALFSSLPSVEMEPSATAAYAPSETGGAVSVSTASSDICHIHELFFYARKLSAEARWFVPDYPGIYQAMLDPNAPRALETDPVWADDPPLFLQKREA